MFWSIVGAIVVAGAVLWVVRFVTLLLMED